MKRIVITDENGLKVQHLDEDAFRIQNGEIELLMNYDSAFELALQLTRLLNEIESETESDEPTGFSRHSLH